MIEESLNSPAQKEISNRSRSQKALFFNQYILTRGGGERLCFEIASALESAGFEISFIIASDVTVDLTSLAQAFGIEPKSNWTIINVQTLEDIAHFCKKEKFDVFINNTFESYIENPAPIGIYVTMFPQPLTFERKQKIATYSIVYCISNFTRLYTLRMWSGTNLKVVVPPISDIHFDQAETKFSEKEKLILCVGRFNVEGHSKCQKEVIETFVKFQNEGVLDPEWRLVVVGRVNDGPDNLQYLGECLKASSVNVSILEGLPLSDLIKLYRRASVLWQFTGFEKNFGVDPELCEHLGLVALDCFAYGAVPIVYHRGGMPYLIEHGINGYCFGDEEELREIMLLFSNNFGQRVHRFQFDNSKFAANKYTFKKFAEDFTNLITEAKNNLAEGNWPLSR